MLAVMIYFCPKIKQQSI